MRIADDQHADRPTQGPDDQTRWQADVRSLLLGACIRLGALRPDAWAKCAADEVWTRALRTCALRTRLGLAAAGVHDCTPSCSCTGGR